MLNKSLNMAKENKTTLPAVLVQREPITSARFISGSKLNQEKRKNARGLPYLRFLGLVGRGAALLLGFCFLLSLWVHHPTPSHPCPSLATKEKTERGANETSTRSFTGTVRSYTQVRFFAQDPFRTRKTLAKRLHLRLERTSIKACTV